ncbi:MAG: gamma-glutamyltransferase [Gemmatimonadetes bacterium]|jgi:gamma-glutamyltranspeptidase/glutathione hydrolase|nr:gamma-glutamyltransferase [Gemmatimonadota bacterium]
MRSPHRWRAVTLWTFALALAVLPIDVVAQTAEPVRASTGMVVSQHWLASEVGRDVLAAGGNAIDAAIATGFALAVVHPTAGNIGGGGFMVVRFPNGQTTAIDFREKAPLASFPEMWLDEKGEYSSDVHHRSAKSVGVPGTVAGFERAHKLYGDMDWQRLVSPAVAIAEDGFELSESLARSLAGFLERRARTPATVAQFSKDGTPYAEGETLRQPDLARTLRRIQGEGRDGFYRGETARLITEEMQRGDGIITRADLELYEARERSTIHGSYRGYEIISMPPPSSGGVAMVTMLNILEGFDLASLGHNSAPYIHLVSEAMRRAFRDRAHYLADADFVDVPVHELTSKAHGSKLRASIAADRASVSEPSDITMGYESPETTHYSVVDGNGMAVSVTYTLESGYGSGIVVSGGGFLLNNEMGDFNAGPGLTDDSGLIGTPANLARPQKRMLSSMTPSIVARDGRLVAVVGSPGGRTIINTVAQVILNVIDFGMNIQMAVNAPRIHHQWLPDRISIEGGGASAATVERLEAMGHTVRMGGGQGSANSIMIDPRTRDRLGAADPRRSDAGARGH